LIEVYIFVISNIPVLAIRLKLSICRWNFATVRPVWTKSCVRQQWKSTANERNCLKSQVY